MSAAAVAASSAVAEHSFLRHVIPFVVRGPGPASWLWRHAFLHKPDPLIVSVLKSLEQVELPELPRMLLAEAFQQLLAGNTPQRDLRRLFTEAQTMCSTLLYNLPDIKDVDTTITSSDTSLDEQHSATPSAVVQALFRSRQECREWAQVLTRSPLHRLLTYELCAACDYYAALMSITSNPILNAEMALYARLTADLYKDKLFIDCAAAFAAHPRDTKTGARLTMLSPGVEAMMKENLLLERDVFGSHRFELHGSMGRNLTIGIQLDHIGKTDQSCSVLLDPVIQQYGNFVLQRRPIYNGRWTEYKLSCAEEDTRLQPSLPLFETVTVNCNSAEKSEKSEAGGSFTVEYNAPLVHPRTYGKECPPFVQTFELAVLPQNRTLFERWFMDR